MKVVSLRSSRLYPQKMFLVLIFTRGWVDPRVMVRSEGNMSLKNPVTPPGIDPETVRLVVQRLNHYATPGPINAWALLKLPPKVRLLNIVYLATLDAVFVVLKIQVFTKMKRSEYDSRFVGWYAMLNGH